MPTPHTPGGHAPGGHEPVGHHPSGGSITVPGGGDGTPILNANATAGPTNNEICQRTGFRLYPGELMRDGYGELMRGKSVDERHPQDFVRSRGGDRQRGSVSPEQDNVFISVSVTAESL